MEEKTFEAVVGLSPFRKVLVVVHEGTPIEEESLGELYYLLDIQDTLELHI